MPITKWRIINQEDRTKIYFVMTALCKLLSVFLAKVTKLGINSDIPEALVRR